MIIEFAKAVSFLLALCLLQGFISRQWPAGGIVGQVLSGVLFGGICIIGMMTPMEFSPGVIFDARSVVLSMSGLFGGPVVGVIAGVIAGGYRLWLGGGGAPVGTATIVACVLLGLAYRYIAQRGVVRIGLWQLLVFGLLVHLSVIALFAFLPDEIVAIVMSKVALPLVLTFTPATAMLGAILLSLEKQVQTNLSLAESDARFRDIAEVSGGWIWEMNAELRFTYLSSRFYELFPYTPDQTLGQTRAAFMAVDKDNKNWRDHYELLEGQKPFGDFAYSFTTPDGGVRHIKISGKPIFDADNVFQGYRGTGDDITDHTNAMAALIDSENKFRSVVDNLPVGVNLKDLDHRYQLVNKILESWYGFSEQDMKGKTASELFDGTQASHARRSRDELQLLSTQTPVTREEKRIRPNGLFQYVSITKFPIKDRQGNLTGIGSTSIDITERRNVEDALRKSETLLRSIIEHAPLMISLLDLDGRYMLVNEAFAKSRGKSPDAIIGTQITDHVSATHAAAAKAHLDKTIAARKTDFEEREATMPNGVSYKALLTKFPIFDNSGTLISIGSIGADITEQKETERQLVLARETAEIANRAKSEFLTNMSHELRTPLNAVIGFSQALGQGLYGAVNDRQKDRIGDVRQAAAHLLDVINDILDLSKIEAGEYAPAFGKVSVSRTIDSALRFLTESAEKANLTLSVDTPSNLPDLYADERILRQMLINLLSNAVKFTPSGGSITVVASTREDSGIQIEVRDTGIGIDPNDLPRAMATFGQVDGSLARQYDGTGLGLPLVEAFMSLHHGEFEIESERNVGTVARLVFPPNPAP
jgi:PAS domain S-box-containing protein